MNATFNFAHQVIAGLDNQIADCAVLIAELEAKLAQVRETQKQLENERQGLLTLAKAGESAIEQAATFLTLAKAANRDDMVQAFWNGIDGLRDERPELPPASEPQPEPSPEPTAPTSDAIDVPSETIADDAQLIGTESRSSTQSSDQKPEWHALNWREFLKYAKGKGLNTKGKTKAEIELELLTQAKR